MRRSLWLIAALVPWLGCRSVGTLPSLEAPAAAEYGGVAGGAGTATRTALAAGSRTEGPAGSAAALAGDLEDTDPHRPRGPADQVGATWWTDFGDPLLSQLIVEGLEHNAALRTAAANFEAAFAQARLDGAPQRPELEAAFDPGRRKQNTAQSGLTEAIPIPIPGFEPGGVRSFAFSSYGLSLNVRWEVDLWGRLGALTAASLAEAAAGEADFEGARLSIAGQVAKLYFGVVEAMQQEDLLERTLASRERTRDRVEARYRRGVATALEVRQARTGIATVEASLAAQRQSLDGLRRQMEVLLGRYPAGEIEAAAGLPELPPLPETGVPADLLARRPDLRAAELRAIASSQRMRAARRSLYPTFRLDGSVGTSSGALNDLLDGDFSVWSLAAGLLQPLLAGGRLRAGLDLVTAGLEAAEADWLQTALAAFAEVESGLVAERMLAERTGALERAAAESREAERLAESRYRQGLVGYLQVLDSQRTSFQSESQLLAARRQQLEARTDLILALGGGVYRASDRPSAPAPATDLGEPTR